MLSVSGHSMPQKHHQNGQLTFTMAEDERITDLPTMTAVRVKSGMMSTAPAGHVTDAALHHFLGLDGTTLKYSPTTEEWADVCGTVITRIDPDAVEASDSPGFMAFLDIGQRRTTSDMPRRPDGVDLSRYLTLYLPTDRCPLHAFWPRRHSQDIMDRTLHDNIGGFLDAYPLPDPELLDRLGVALCRASVSG